MRRNKTLAIALIFVMLVMAFATVVYATTSADLANQLYAKGEKYGMTAADKVKIERYLSENPVTDADADKIVAKADEAIAVMEKAGTTDYSKLTTAQKDELKAIAKSAGKLIETVTENNGKLAYTGNNLNVVLVVSTIAMIALAITVATKRTNAK